MTPHPPSHLPRRATTRDRSSGRSARRAVAVGALIVAAAAPLTAQAAGPTPERAAGPSTPSSIAALGAELAEVPDHAVATRLQQFDGSRNAASSAGDSTLSPEFVAITATYTWSESSSRVEDLQRALGIAVDGVYGMSTRLAHASALGGLGLPAAGLPLPPGPSAEAWAAMRDCESNGNYAITNPSGKYRGAYQFDRSTWNSVASRHAPELVGVDPAAASPADQDAMALALYSERGASPWPHCGRHIR